MAKYDRLHHELEAEAPKLQLPDQSRQQLEAALNLPKETLFRQVVKVDQMEAFIDLPSIQSLSLTQLNQIMVDAVVKCRNYYDFKKLGSKGNTHLKKVMVQAIEKLAVKKGVDIDYRKPEGVDRLFESLKIENKIQFQLKRQVANGELKADDLGEWRGKGLEIFERELLKKHLLLPDETMKERVKQLTNQVLSKHISTSQPLEVVSEGLTLEELNEHLAVFKAHLKDPERETNAKKLTEAVDMLSRVSDWMNGEKVDKAEVQKIIRRLENFDSRFAIGIKCIDYLKSLTDNAENDASPELKEQLINPENTPAIQQMEGMAEAIKSSGHPEAAEAVYVLKSYIKEAKGAEEKIELPSEEELVSMAEEVSDKKLKTDQNILQVLRASVIASPLMLVMVFLIFLMGNLKPKLDSHSKKSSSGSGISTMYQPGGVDQIDDRLPPGGSDDQADSSPHPSEETAKQQDKKIETLKFSKKEIQQRLKSEKRKNKKARKRLKKANQSIEDLQKQANDAEANAKSMADQIKKKEAANLNLNQQVKTERSAKDKAQQKVVQLTGEKQKVEKQLQNLEHQKKQVDNKLKKTKEKLDSEKQMNKKKLRKLQRQLEKLQKKNQKLEKKKNQLEAENKGLKDDLKIVEKDLKDAQSENINLNRENDRLKSKIAVDKERRQDRPNSFSGGRDLFNKNKKQKTKKSPKPKKSKAEKIMEKKMQKALQESKEKMFPPGTLG